MKSSIFSNHLNRTLFFKSIHQIVNLRGAWFRIVMAFYHLVCSSSFFQGRKKLIGGFNVFGKAIQCFIFHISFLIKIKQNV